MSYIGYVIISDRTFKDNNENLNIVKPFSILHLDNLPNNYSFHITFSLFDLAFETEYRLTATMYGAEENSLWEFGGDMKLDAPEDQGDLTKGRGETEINIPVQNFKFTQKGVHRVAIALEEKHSSNETLHKEVHFQVLVKNEGESNDGS